MLNHPSNPWDRNQRCPKCNREVRYKLVDRPADNPMVHFSPCECGHLRASVYLSSLQWKYAMENEFTVCTGDIPERVKTKPLPREYQEIEDKKLETMRRRLRGL